MLQPSPAHCLRSVGRNAATGSALWRAPVGNTDLIDAHLLALTSPTGPVFVIELGHEFIGYDARTGAREWDLELPPDTGVDGVAAISGGLLIQASGAQYFIQGH